MGCTGSRIMFDVRFSASEVKSQKLEGAGVASNWPKVEKEATIAHEASETTDSSDTPAADKTNGDSVPSTPLHNGLVVRFCKTRSLLEECWFYSRWSSARSQPKTQRSINADAAMFLSKSRSTEALEKALCSLASGRLSVSGSIGRLSWQGSLRSSIGSVDAEIEEVEQEARRTPRTAPDVYAAWSCFRSAWDADCSLFRCLQAIASGEIATARNTRRAKSEPTLAESVRLAAGLTGLHNPVSGGAVQRGPSRLVELFLIVGLQRPAVAKEQCEAATPPCTRPSKVLPNVGEPQVLLRVPAPEQHELQRALSPASCASDGSGSCGDEEHSARTRASVSFDHRIASFCFAAEVSPTGCSGAIPQKHPFSFTILGSALPRKHGDQAHPDPTDLLYCTVVCFASSGSKDVCANTEGSYAYCIVSRHPFVSAFGDWLLQLHDKMEAMRLERAKDWLTRKRKFLRSSKWSRTPSLPDRPPGLCSVTNGYLLNAVAQLRAAVPGTRAAAPTLLSCRSDAALGGVKTFTSLSTQVAADISTVLDIGPLPGDAPTGATVETSTAKEYTQNRTDFSAFAYPAPGHFPGSPRVDLAALQRSEVLLKSAALPIFVHLRVDAILQILTALLLEFKVLIISPCPAVGSAMVLGLSALLWPFAWQHLQLAVCPPGVQEIILEAPVPFLCALPEEDGMFDNGGELPVLAEAHGLVACRVVDGSVIIAPGPMQELLRPDRLPLPLRHRQAELERLHSSGPIESRRQQRVTPCTCADFPISKLRGPRRPDASEMPALHAQIARTFDDIKADTRGVPLSADAAAAAMCREVRAGLLETCRILRSAYESAGTEIGSRFWERQMVNEIRRQAPLAVEDEAFFTEFVCTQTSLMFLGTISD